MNYIYRYSKYFGRGYGCEGMFVATPGEIKQICSQTIHFGEINGKHSECSIDFVESDFEIVDASPEILEWFVENIGETGYNPLGYLRCPSCDVDWSEETTDECEACQTFLKESSD